MKVYKSITGSFLLVREVPRIEGYTNVSPLTRDVVVGEVTAAELTDIANQCESVKGSEPTLRVGTLDGQTGRPVDTPGDLAFTQAGIAVTATGAPPVKIERGLDPAEPGAPPQPSQRVSPHDADVVAIQQAAATADATASGSAADASNTSTDGPAPVRPASSSPTLEEYVRAGYKAENYPPAGYSPVNTAGWQQELARREAKAREEAATAVMGIPSAPMATSTPPTSAPPAAEPPATAPVPPPATTPVPPPHPDTVGAPPATAPAETPKEP